MGNLDFLSDIKVVIFDMDGTLYQDEGFVGRKVKLLAKDTKWEGKEEEIIRQGFELLNGKKSLKLGNFYREGAACPGDDVVDIFDVVPYINEPGETSFCYDPNDGYVFMGDGWSLTFFLGNRMNCGRDKILNSFFEVRKEMIDGPHKMEINPEMADIVKQITKKLGHTYLFTNTQAESAVGFVSYMGYDSAFGTVKFGTGKPYGLRDMLPEILEETGADISQVLSIGDHSFNDLAPVRDLGGHTILATPYEIYDNVPWDIRVKTIPELTEILKKLL